MKVIKFKFVLFLFALLGVVGWGPFSLFSSSHDRHGSWLNREIDIIRSQARNLDRTVLKHSLIAYLKARKKGLNDKEILTVIDYRLSSDKKRLWVIDIKRGKVLFNTWVSHGKNSGKMTPTSFSNQPGSLKSSVGVFLTENPYIGSNGYSLRLIGLEHGINDNAYRRAIVVHGAWYVNPEMVRHYGQLGKSWGCPAVSDRLARPLIDAIKGRTLVFVYANDHKWLNNSTYLAG